MPLLKRSTSSLIASSKVGGAGQWQRLGTAIARYHAFKACASQVSISALWRRHGRYASASSTSVTMHHTASRSLVAEWHIVTCMCLKFCWFGQWQRRITAIAKALGDGSLTHRAGNAIASSVVILVCSRSLVPAQHHHLRQFDRLYGKSCGQGVSHDLTPSIQCQCFATGQHERCGAG